MAGLNVTQRPNLIKNIFGNQEVKKVLLSLFKRDPKSFPNAFLITGPSGCGKTTVARIIAHKLGAYDPKSETSFNYKELDAADFRGIDTSRKIRETMNYAPIGQCSYRVWLLDECHMLTKEAQEALLKNLEEPPKHVVFLLATTEPQKLKDTLQRRCLRISMNKLTREEMEEYILTIYESIKSKKIPSEAIIDQIYEISKGSPGIAIKVIDSIMDVELSEKELLKMVNDLSFGGKEEKEAIELCRALTKARKWTDAQNVFDSVLSETNDYERLRRAIIGYMDKILRTNKKFDPKIFLILDAFISADVYNNGASAITHAAISALEGME